MSTELSVKKAFCDGYRDLLWECQFALRVWKERRDDIHRPGMRSRKCDDELRTLQAKYARALTLLQNHAHDCPVCELVTEIIEDDSENGSNVSSGKVVYIC